MAVPYVTSFERMARREGKEEGLREGLLEGIALALAAKFGSRGSKLVPRNKSIQDIEELREVMRTIQTATKLEEIRRHLA